MIIKTISKDLLQAFEEMQFDAIAHGCNCFHTMGAGVAGAIARRFPRALESDKLYTSYGDKDKLGEYTLVITDFGDIINGYTQFQLGKCPTDELYSNIRKLFTSLNIDYVGETIGIPRIGSGIAGGSWSEIEKIINETTPDVNIIVCVQPEQVISQVNVADVRPQLRQDIDESSPE